MDNNTNIAGTVDFHILTQALEAIAKKADIPLSVVQKVNQLNAKKCGVIQAQV